MIAVHSRKSSSNTTQYFHYDALHSIEAITDHQGKVLERFRYTPFGERIATKGNDNVTTRGYTGHEHLAGIGLIHMNARIYDPVLQRFLSPDTIVQAPLDAQSYNRFAYVRNNPQKYTDPSGHSWWSDNVTRRTSSSWNGLKRAARRISNEIRRIGRDIRNELKRLCDSGCYVSAETNGEETRVSGGGGGGQVRAPSPGTSSQSSVGVSITINSRGQISSYSAYVGYGGANFGYTTGGDYSGGELFAEGLSGDRYSIYGFGRNSHINSSIVFADGEARGSDAVVIGERLAVVRDRVLREGAADPDAKIALSPDDVEAILRFQALRTSKTERNSWFNWSEYTRDFEHADTFIYGDGLATRTFLIYGAPVKGGNFNYVGVGMMAAHYYHSRTVLELQVNAWNIKQTVDGEGYHNIVNIPEALKWANVGYSYYVRNR